MIVGPDGKPIQVAPVLGAPKLEDLDVFTPEEMVLVADPIRQAMAAGVPAMSPCNVEFVMVARLVRTVLALQTPMPSLVREGEGEE